MTGSSGSERGGREKKFVNEVEQVTFSGKTAKMNNLDVIFITERCVFTLTDEGVELTEIAPGVGPGKGHPGLHGFQADREDPEDDGREDLQAAAHGSEKRSSRKPMSETDDL